MKRRDFLKPTAAFGIGAEGAPFVVEGGGGNRFHFIQASFDQ